MLYKFFILLHQSKYKEASKKDMQSGSFTTLSETRDTAHSKEVNKLISGVKLHISHLLYKICSVISYS